MSHQKLFSEYKLGPITLNNRLVMSPMTRCRCLNNMPGDLVVTYYAQRASAGLIITEGTSPSPNGLGYPRIPGLFSPEQTAKWRIVADAVHNNNGRIFAQLMHTGRVGHPLNLPAGAQVLAPSPIAAPDEMYTDQEGPKAVPIPTEMSETQIYKTIREYEATAKNAIKAGLDGVELHGANGYLIDQFLNTASNNRGDKWGQTTIEDRARFALLVTKKTAAAIGGSKVGIRLSPYGVFNGMQPDDQMDALYVYLAQELSKLSLVYIHLVDHSAMGAPKPKPELISQIRESFSGTLILSGGYDDQRAESDLIEGKGDLIAFGRPFIANPNLVSKIKNNQTLAEPNPDLFYTADEKGYTDYPE